MTNQSNLPSTQEREKEVKTLVFSAQKQFEATTKSMNFIKEAGFAIQILTNNQYLAKADPNSIRHAVANIAQTELTLNPALKYAYLVPRNSKDGLKCILDISYIGMIKLLTDAGSVKNIDAGVIYSNDEYDFRRGNDPYFKHKPALSKRGDMMGAYAIAFLRDGGFQFEIMGKEEIEKVRATSESWKNEKGRQYSPWETWTDEMWKKTVLKRLFKLLPKTHFSETLIAAISNDHNNEMSDLNEESKHEQWFSDVQEIQEIKEETQPKQETNK